jgi:RNA recognition motif-containing protein
MINRDDGRFSGTALVLFNSIAEADEALNEMQGQNIGHRWIEIFPISYQDFKDKNSGFRGGAGGSGGRQQPTEDVLLSKFLNASNVSRCCKLGGLPFRVRTEEI